MYTLINKSHQKAGRKIFLQKLDTKNEEAMSLLERLWFLPNFHVKASAQLSFHNMGDVAVENL